MCGRYVITAQGNIIADIFNLDEVPQIPVRYNIAPSQPILAIRNSLNSRDPRPEAHWFTWGLVPGWADKPQVAFKTINARSESARSKPSFRDAYKYRRCIIPASGYYEWKETGAGKLVPHFLQRSDQRIIWMAGLWEHWMSPDGSEIESATILTRDSRSHVAISAVHHRMPVMLETSQFAKWMQPMPPKEAEYWAITECTIDAAFDAWPVSDHVNKASNEGPALLDRVATLEQGELF